MPGKPVKTISVIQACLADLRYFCCNFRAVAYGIFFAVEAIATPGCALKDSRRVEVQVRTNDDGDTSPTRLRTTAIISFVDASPLTVLRNSRIESRIKPGANGIESVSPN